MTNVAPLLDYNKTIDLAPDKTFGIGGQIEIDANFTGSSATLASYQQIGAISLDNVYGLYPVCQTKAGTPDYNQNDCLLRGIGGQYDNATLQVSWQRKVIDPLGEVWTPFAFMRANGNFLSYNTSYSDTFSSNGVSDTISNGVSEQFPAEQ